MLELVLELQRALDAALYWIRRGDGLPPGLDEHIVELMDELRDHLEG